MRITGNTGYTITATYLVFDCTHQAISPYAM
jgi:hypothetical protein